MTWRALARLVSGFLLFHCFGCRSGPTEGHAPQPRMDTKDPLGRLEKLLFEARSVQWRADLEVLEGKEIPGLAEGSTSYYFQVQGPSRVHWKITRAADGPSSESWYQGLVVYTRGSTPGDSLVSREVGQGEGGCFLGCLIHGGMVGWTAAHHWNIPLAPPEVTAVRRETIDGRDAILVEHNLKLGGICGVYQKFAPVKLWLDPETGLPLRREYALTFRQGEESVIPFRAREVYSGWKLDEALPESAFRTEGMKPPEVAADLPRDPDRYEEVQTQRPLPRPVDARRLRPKNPRSPHFFLP